MSSLLVLECPLSMRFGVYVHFPYCRKRCPYCDFAVSAIATIPHRTYVEAVLRELQERKLLFPKRELVSIYLGGGTPSLWNPDCVHLLLQTLLHTFSTSPTNSVEITLECDPLDLLEAKGDWWNTLLQAGVNRLSIGVQSTQDHRLHQLGRLHTAAQGQQAVRWAQEQSSCKISLDLMMGLPKQTPQELRSEIAQFVALQPDHLSLYQLTIEPHTAFAAAVRKKQWNPLEEEQQAVLYQQVQAELEQAGFEQYEISSYARKSHNQDTKAVHNQLYWTGGEYLGLGVSAHSFRRFDDGSAERFANTRSPATYLRSFGATKPSLPLVSAHALYEKLSPSVVEREALWLGLRRNEGISRSWFLAQYKTDFFHSYKKEIRLLEEKGWLQVEQEKMYLTAKGILFADSVGEIFLAE